MGEAGERTVAEYRPRRSVMPRILSCEECGKPVSDRCQGRGRLRMGQFRQAPAAAEAQATTPKPAVPVPKVRKAVASAVTPNSSKTVTGSQKRGRPRVLSDDQRRERVRRRVAGWRAASRAGSASTTPWPTACRRPCRPRPTSSPSYHRIPTTRPQSTSRRVAHDLVGTFAGFPGLLRRLVGGARDLLGGGCHRWQRYSGFTSS